MILIEKEKIVGFEEAIRGMRNPMNSWEKSDSGICKSGEDGIGCDNCFNSKKCEHTYDRSFQVGVADYKLMHKLALNGPVHAKYRRMIVVYVDVTAPLYWWKEFDTYKVGTVANSCSTMHKIQEKEFSIDDFSYEHLNCSNRVLLCEITKALNAARAEFLAEDQKTKSDWWQMIQLLPSSYNQKRTLMMNYEVLAGIYPMRQNHKLDEWRAFCEWIEALPYSSLITNWISD